MKYRNVIIKCKKEKFEELQKYLFKLKYSWIDNGNKHRHIKTFNDEQYIVIHNDAIMYNEPQWLLLLNIKKYRVIKYPNFIRKEKLQKLNGK
jgi:hypothetical protein